MLPAFVLAGLGWHSLRQDRELARLEARTTLEERAEELAEEVLPEVLERGAAYLSGAPGETTMEAVMVRAATGESRAPVCAIDDAGNLEYPPPLNWRIPHDPLDLDQLEPEARRLWESAVAARMVDRDDRASVRLYDRFIETDPPERFEAIAHARVAAALIRLRWPDEARETLERILREFPDVQGETGLNLSWFARTHLLRLTPAAAEEEVARTRMRELAEPMLRDAFDSPTFLTEGLLLEVQRCEWNLSDAYGYPAEPMFDDQRAPIFHEWMARWGMHQDARIFYRMFERASQGRFTPVWLELQADRFWLARKARAPSESGGWLVAERREELELPLREAIAASRTARGLEIGVDFGGRTLVPMAEDLEGGVVTQVQSERLPGLVVRAAMTDMTELADRLAVRTRRFAALIGVSFVAVMIGFLSAWRAFREQIRLSELKSNFVSSVSHELRTPIASVSLMAEELRDLGMEDPEQSREYHEFIVKECRRLTSLIENILDYSRIERGAKEYEFEAVDLVSLTEQTVRSLEAYAHEHGVRLEMEQEGEPAAVRADARAIQGSLVNLIDNAIKHSPADTSVKVGVGFQGEAARLWVKDEGPSIPAADRERVFERFYRRGSELRRETKGTGLGLAIVKHAVDAHGGQIQVTGDEGRGSCFAVILPAELPPSKNGSQVTGNER